MLVIDFLLSYLYFLENKIYHYDLVYETLVEESQVALCSTIFPFDLKKKNYLKCIHTSKKTLQQKYMWNSEKEGQ